MPRNYGLWPSKYERLGTTFNPEVPPRYPYVIEQDSTVDNDWGSLVASLFVIMFGFALVVAIGIGIFLLAMVFG